MFLLIFMHSQVKLLINPVQLMLFSQAYFCFKFDGFKIKSYTLIKFFKTFFDFFGIYHFFMVFIFFGRFLFHF